MTCACLEPARVGVHTRGIDSATAKSPPQRCAPVLRSFWNLLDRSNPGQRIPDRRQLGFRECACFDVLGRLDQQLAFRTCCRRCRMGADGFAANNVKRHCVFLLSGGDARPTRTLSSPPKASRLRVIPGLLSLLSEHRIACSGLAFDTTIALQLPGTLCGQSPPPCLDCGTARCSSSALPQRCGRANSGIDDRAPEPVRRWHCPATALPCYYHGARTTRRRGALRYGYRGPDRFVPGYGARNGARGGRDYRGTAVPAAVASAPPPLFAAASARKPVAHCCRIGTNPIIPVSGIVLLLHS